jgi:hypothetical protein
LKNLTPGIDLERCKDLSAAHVSDLLSDVLAHAPRGGLLVTIQIHMNVIAVSVHAGLAGVIFASGRTPDQSVIEKAVEEQTPLFVSEEPAFNVVGRLYALGLRGGRG